MFQPFIKAVRSLQARIKIHCQPLPYSNSGRCWEYLKTLICERRTKLQKFNLKPSPPAVVAKSNPVLQTQLVYLLINFSKYVTQEQKRVQLLCQPWGSHIVIILLSKIHKTSPLACRTRIIIRFLLTTQMIG